MVPRRWGASSHGSSARISPRSRARRSRRPRPTGPSSMACTSASSAPAAPPPARPTGGTQRSTSAQPRCSTPTGEQGFSRDAGLAMEAIHSLSASKSSYPMVDLTQLFKQQNISLCVTEFFMHSGFGSIHYVPHNEVFHAYSVAKDDIFS
ncbi:hypothetical protein ZEAMMB73_Zm00001d044915 [Zea mays]|uniref:Uncharacterized protein n=1 Tax=Zea mays TaxID=4577 RepID=A0A1D6NS91_MAIZE|nr:hypothetical protein ZEAMMB73_Zm00001d044915 [Zea mays]AQL01125.1 hypothetical protein ZEAMMB73_Zm00001d044915 [Zea mays]